MQPAPHRSWSCDFRGLGLLLASLAAGACTTAPPLPIAAVSPDAEEALRMADELGELPDVAMREESRAQLERAQALAPDWVAPARLLQNLERDLLRGHAAYADALDRVERAPRDASALYLLGRLEPGGARPRFEAARRADPRFAWAWHGLAVERQRDGLARESLAAEERALALARASHELRFFAESASQAADRAGAPERGTAAIARALADERLLPHDRAALRAASVARDLALPRQRWTWHFEEALALLEHEELDPRAMRALVQAALESSGPVPSNERRRALATAAGAREGPGRDDLALDLLESLGSRRLAASLRPDAESGPLPHESPAERARAFAAGSGPAEIGRWAVALPRFLLDPEGLPREPALAEMVRAARAVGGAPEPPELERVGAALLAAGWYEEALGFSEWYAGRDPARAFDLARRATTGQSAIDRIRGLLGSVDEHGSLPQAAPLGSIGAPRSIGKGGATGAAGAMRERSASLDDLLDALEPRLAEAARASGVSVHHERPLARSPRLSFQPVFELVHPGPRFSAADEARGLGRAGQPVPGLATALGAIGRFGLFGAWIGGGGPDGTILRLLGSEQRRGAHLGVPWHGTIAWCDGTDVAGRPGRAGGAVGGAALHEGYYIDLAVVRAEHRGWLRLAERFLGPRSGALAERALDADAARARALPGSPLGRERARALPWLGEGSRVALAVLAERAAASDLAPSDLVSFEETLAVYETHEQGHLCERTRFLPLGRHWPAVIGFLASSRFSPSRVLERLEYRAELVALCSLPDPRLGLAHLLGVAEGGGAAMPHAAAFEELAEDLLEELSLALDRDPGAFPGVDPERYLAHQLHRLDPEALRRLAFALAKAEGLTTRGWTGEPKR